MSSATTGHGTTAIRQDGDTAGLPGAARTPGRRHTVPLLQLHAVVLHGHDQHQVRGDHVEAQHAREGRVQVHQVAEHLLPGRNEQSWKSDLLLHRQAIQNWGDQRGFVDLSRYPDPEAVLSQTV